MIYKDLSEERDAILSGIYTIVVIIMIFGGASLFV